MTDHRDREYEAEIEVRTLRAVIEVLQSERINAQAEVDETPIWEDVMLDCAESYRSGIDSALRLVSALLPESARDEQDAA